MDDPKRLTGTWVEIQERGSSVRCILMRADANVPPTRGGRRQLELTADGAVRSMAQGATDRMEAAAEGQWQLQDDTLKLNLDGWEGDYDVETMTDTELILHRR